jgi:hypothetical protein
MKAHMEQSSKAVKLSSFKKKCESLEIIKSYTNMYTIHIYTYEDYMKE